MEDRCLCCTCEEETTIHLYRCKAEEMKKILQNGINDLEDDLQTRHVPSDMWQAMRAGILTFSNGEIYEARDERGSCFSEMDWMGSVFQRQNIIRMEQNNVRQVHRFNRMAKIRVKTKVRENSNTDIMADA